MIDDLNFYIAGKRSLKISSVNNVVISQKNILGIRSLIISGCDSSISIKENFLKEDIEIVKKRIIEFVR